jgi:hypothetical protein
MSIGAALSRRATTATRRQKLKSCHQAFSKRVSRPGNGQGPLAPRGNSIADKDAASAKVWAGIEAELHCYK